MTAEKKNWKIILKIVSELIHIYFISDYFQDYFELYFSFINEEWKQNHLKGGK